VQSGNLVFGTPFAVGKDRIVDDRWNDLSKSPASNGPLALTTPPAQPSFALPSDGQLVEFALSYPMHVVDTTDWPALNCRLGNRSIKIHKPIPIQSPYQPKEMIGNEPPDTFCSIVRVSCDYDPSLPFPSVAELWPLVERLCEWIRIKCRHYWVLHGQAGFSATMHASVLTQQSDTISQKNVVGYGQNLIVLPMDIGLWKSIEAEIISNVDPPVSEALFCDALVSAFGGDEIKTVLELGVAAEVEITDLLTTAAKMVPVTSAKKKFLKQQPKFVPKLCEWPQKLGLDATEQFMQPGFPPDWVDSVRELYRYRNSVAHSGKISGSSPMQHLFKYISATSALLAFSRDQRIKFGMPHYSYPAARAPFGQILLYSDGIMTGETITSTGKKA
jgi:hypothetical protein